MPTQRICPVCHRPYLDYSDRTMTPEPVCRDCMKTHGDLFFDYEDEPEASY